MVGGGAAPQPPPETSPPPRLSYYVAGRTGMPAFSSEIDDEGKTMSAGRTCLLSRISPTSFHLRRQPAVLSVDKQQPCHFGKVHHPGRVVMLAGRFQSARARVDDKRKKARENMRVGFFEERNFAGFRVRLCIFLAEVVCEWQLLRWTTMLPDSIGYLESGREFRQDSDCILRGLVRGSE